MITYKKSKDCVGGTIIDVESIEVNNPTKDEIMEALSILFYQGTDDHVAGLLGICKLFPEVYFGKKHRLGEQAEEIYKLHREQYCLNGNQIFWFFAVQNQIAKKAPKKYKNEITLVAYAT